MQRSPCIYVKAGGDNKHRTRRFILSLLKHGMECKGHCMHMNCKLMKKLIDHPLVCEVKLQGKCTTCERYWQLIATHSKECDSVECKVRDCKMIKDYQAEQALISQIENLKLET